jgi:hypothetical protein
VVIWWKDEGVGKLIREKGRKEGDRCMKRVTEKKTELLLHVIFQNFKCQNEIFRYGNILAPRIFAGFYFI